MQSIQLLADARAIATYVDGFLKRNFDVSLIEVALGGTVLSLFAVAGYVMGGR